MTSKQHICILGDTVIGAMAAAYFAKNLPSSDYEITYFEDRQKSVSDILHSSLHADSRNFIRDLKYPEARFVSQTDAVFSLGEKNNGIDLKTDYINTYSPYGLSLEGIDFLSVMQRMGGEKSLKGWENYNLAASMIRHGKFNPPDSKGRPIISDYSYGYQVDTELFHNLLRDIALDEAVTLRDLKDIKRCYFNKNQHGAIEFQSGETITPDFIIDASSHGLFIESDDLWQSSKTLTNMFLTVEAKPSSNFENHVSHNVVENGLETQITLQSKTLTLSINDQGDGQGYKLGRLREPWVNNVVHLGGAYGLLPIMGAPLRINQIAIERLLALFPADANMEAERSEYNSLMLRAYDRFEDFQSLWLSKSGFTGNRQCALSEDAKYRQRLFQARGRLPNFDDDMLFQDHWMPMFLGQGIWPKAPNPLADNLSDETLKKFSEEYVSIVKSATSQMPNTAQFIKKHASSTVNRVQKEPQSGDIKEQAKTKTMASHQPIKSVVIAGGGTAGWMTAAALARTLGDSGINITLIESEAIGTVGVGEATIPNIATFNAMLGIDEASFMKATQATIKYGIEFAGWTREGDSYFHPFGQHGHQMAGLSFHHLWHKLYKEGKADRIEAYCVTAMAAKHGKASLPARDPNSIMSSLSHAYQFDAGRYALFLRQYAEKLGVTRIEGKITDVDLDVENGFIQSLGLENNQSVDADLFIDCTGFRALLANKALEVGYEDWSHWLPCDSAQAVGCSKSHDAVPYTRATARKAGWQWRIPLQHRTGNGYVYASDYISDEDVTETLLQNLDGTPLGTPKQLRFKTGRRKKLWHKNCVAIGLSAGFLEPLESTSIYLIQAGISRLMALFPDKGFNEIEAAEYNKLMALEFEQVRDFLILHYVANERHGEPFWDYVRHMPIPDSLEQKIDLFKHRGRFFRYEGDLFTETSWVAVFLGQNIMPSGHSPLVDGLPQQKLQETLAFIKSEITGNIPRMPSHEEFLSRYCPAPALN
jgi:tryptophan halogenase